MDYTEKLKRAWIRREIKNALMPAMALAFSVGAILTCALFLFVMACVGVL